MTISPPTNVKSEVVGVESRVLASGIDTLELAIDLEWGDAKTFGKLTELKAAAKALSKDASGMVTFTPEGTPFIFTVKPNGSEGYEWILVSRDFYLRIGNWLSPKSRPSVMARFSSEALWLHGPDAMLQRLVELFATLGAAVNGIKVSRVDLCADVLIDESIWVRELLDQLVTRARKKSPYFDGDAMEGIKVGRGDVVCRMYDKPREIRTQSHKDWMYDIWKVERVPAGGVVVRVEYQLRREALKERGIDSFEDLKANLPEVWAYCTQSWLKVQENADKHHTQQEPTEWWKVVQAGFAGAQDANAVVRVKSISTDRRYLEQQAIGSLSSYIALLLQGQPLPRGAKLSKNSYAILMADLVRKSTMSDHEFTERVKIKQAKAARALPGYRSSPSIAGTDGLSDWPKGEAPF